VAEYDKKLQNYFVVTDAFQHLVSGEADIVSGDKGTGKTAIYQYLKTSYKTVPELSGVEVITGFNPSGEPIFRRLGDEAKLTEGQYVTIWKMYFLSLVGNWLLREYRGSLNPKLQKLESLLGKIGLLNSGESANTVFSRLVEWLRTNAAPKELGVDISFNESGIPVYTPKIVIGKKETHSEHIPIEMISHDEAFSILDKALAEKSKIAWVVLDRLDEAFIGRPDIEIPALRALIRTFMDLQPYDYVRVKLFVRKDLFRKITQEGFVNLTHVNARCTEIGWEESDLLEMVCQRIRTSGEILRYAGLSRLNDKALFYAIFPRNLIDLCGFAQDFQLKKDRNTNREFGPNSALIESDSLKKAAVKLSNQRLTDTLMAEYGNDVKVAIKAFENSKAEHTEETLATLFGFSDPHQTRLVARILCDVGFLEKIDETYRVPFLYRPALNITKGKVNNENPVAKKPGKK
jgi:hypothetical protein